MNKVLHFIKPTFLKIILAIVYFIPFSLISIIITNSLLFKIASSFILNELIFSFFVFNLVFILPIIGPYLLSCVFLSHIKDIKLLNLFHFTFGHIIITIIFIPFTTLSLIIIIYTYFLHYSMNSLPPVIFICTLLSVILSSLFSILIDILYIILENSMNEKKCTRFSYFNLILSSIIFSFLFLYAVFLSFDYGGLPITMRASETMSQIIFNNNRFRLHTSFSITVIIMLLLSLLLSYLIKPLIIKWKTK
jgi:hypothetical protein